MNGRDNPVRSRHWRICRGAAGSATLLTTLIAAAQPASIDPQAARSAFAELGAASQADGGALWGRPMARPMMFADPVSRAVVADRADAEGRLTARDGIYVGTLPPEVGIANHALRWAGVDWTMVMWPLPNDAHDRISLMAHESFHRIQNDLGLPAANPTQEHLDEQDGRLWMRAELRALARAMRPSPKAQREAAADALLFRAVRHARCGAAAAEHEAALELNEGLAEYTGVRLCGLDAQGQLAKAARRLRAEEASATFGRSFAYATGPAYGLLLDGVRPGWNRALKKGDRIAALLAEAINFKAVESPETEARAALLRYDGDELQQAETKRHEERRARLADWTKRFVDGPALELKPGAEFSFTFDPTGVDSLPGHGQVMQSLRASDQWGVLEVKAGGVLLVSDGGGAIAALRVARPDWGHRTTEPDKRLVLESKDGAIVLTLNPGFELAVGARSKDLRIRRRK